MSSGGRPSLGPMREKKSTISRRRARLYVKSLGDEVDNRNYVKSKNSVKKIGWEEGLQGIEAV